MKTEETVGIKALTPPCITIGLTRNYKRTANKKCTKGLEASLVNLNRPFSSPLLSKTNTRSNCKVGKFHKNLLLPKSSLKIGLSTTPQRKSCREDEPRVILNAIENRLDSPSAVETIDTFGGWEFEKDDDCIESARRRAAFSKYLDADNSESFSAIGYSGVSSCDEIAPEAPKDFIPSSNFNASLSSRLEIQEHRSKSVCDSNDVVKLRDCHVLIPKIDDSNYADRCLSDLRREDSCDENFYRVRIQQGALKLNFKRLKCQKRDPVPDRITERASDRS